MVNFIGGLPAIKSVLTIPHAHHHLYAKVPHATVRSDSKEQYEESVQRLLELAKCTDDS